MPRPAAKAACVTPETARHGDYRDERVAAPDGTIATAQRNRGASTVDRWRAAGELSADQDWAIKLYMDAVRLSLDEPRIVANYCPTAAIRTTGGDVATTSAARVQATRLLEHLDKTAFAHLAPRTLEVFRRVVMLEQTAAVAGGLLESSPAAAKVAAKQAVRFVADAIALAMNSGRARAA